MTSLPSADLLPEVASSALFAPFLSEPSDLWIMLWNYCQQELKLPCPKVTSHRLNISEPQSILQARFIEPSQNSILAGQTILNLAGKHGGGFVPRKLASFSKSA